MCKLQFDSIINDRQTVQSIFEHEKAHTGSRTITTGDRTNWLLWVRV